MGRGLRYCKILKEVLNTENQVRGSEYEDFHHRSWEHSDHKSMMKYVVIAAKSELLKEKVKKRLEEVEGKKLDEIAKVLVDSKLEFIKAKKEMWKKKKDMKERIWETWEK